MEKKLNMDTRINPQLDKLFKSYKPGFGEDFSQEVLDRLSNINSRELFDKQIGKYSIRTALIGFAAIAIVLILIGSQGSLSIDSLIGVEQISDMEFSSILFEDSPF